MKKKILCMFVCLAAVTASFQLATKREKLDDLMLENIEALASDEEDGMVYCFGSGSVDCPRYNVKVYMVQRTTGYALD